MRVKYNMKSLGKILFSLLILAGAVSSTSAQSPDSAVILSDGQKIEAKLGQNEKANFQVNLKAGQFLRVTSDQLAGGVVLSLFDPNGKEISVNDKFAVGVPERISYIAEQTGEYKIEVKTEDKTATDSFRLECRIKDAPSDVDKDFIMAEKLLNESSVALDGDLTKEKALAALDKRRQSLAIWQKIGDKYFENYTLSLIGNIYEEVYRKLTVDQAGIEFYAEPKPPFKMAVEFFNQAIELSRQIKDQNNEAKALIWLGGLYFNAGDYQKYVEYNEQALTVSRSLGNLNFEAIALINLGSGNSNQGKSEEAIEYYMKAVEILKKVADKENETTVLDNMGTAYFKLKNTEKSLEYFLKALEVSRTTPNHFREGNILSSIAWRYVELKDKEKALDYFNQSLAIYRQSKDRQNEAWTINDIGDYYKEWQEYTQGAELYRQSLAIFREINNRYGEATVLRDIGDLQLIKNENQAALESFNKSLIIWNEIGNKQKAFELNQSIGNTFDRIDEKPTTNSLKLEPDKTIEKEIGGINADNYTIKLKAGQFLRINVEQKGVDVVLKLYDSENKKVAERDAPNERDGFESLSFVSKNSDEYRIVIRPLETTAKSGNYTLRIESPRVPTKQDVIRIAAENAFIEARELQKGNLQNATVKYQEAIKYWTQLEDLYWHSLALHSAIENYEASYDFLTALNLSKQLLSLYFQLGDRRNEAYTLRKIGSYYSASWIKRDLKVGDEESIKYQLQALEIYRSLNDKPSEANTLRDLGGQHALKEKSKALDYLNKALLIYKSLGNSSEEANTLSNISGLYKNLGEKSKSAEYLKRAAQVNLTTGNKYDKISAYLYLARMSREELNFKESLRNLCLALAETLTLNDEVRQQVRLLYGIGNIHRRLGNFNKAIEYLSESQKISEEIFDPVILRQVLQELGEIYAENNEPDKAINYFNRALKVRLEESPEADALSLYSIARIERGRNNLFAARENIEKAIKIVESLRSELKSQELRSSYFATVRDYYEFYTDLLMDMHKRQPDKGFDRKAFEASERGRARSLLETLTEARADIRQGADPKLVERERELQKQLNSKAKEQTESRGAEQAKQIASEIEEITTELEQVKAQIRQTSPRYAALTQPQPLTLREIQTEVLDKDTVLLEYSLGAERSFLWMVTKDAIESFELPKRDEIEKDARAVYAALTNPESFNPNRGGVGKQKRGVDTEDLSATDQDSFSRLSKILLAPVMGKIAGKRLLVVSDGALQFVPFSALDASFDKAKTANYEPLVLKNEIVSLPSASTLAVLRRENANRKPAPNSLAVFADPVFESNDKRLKPENDKRRDSEKPAEQNLESRSFPLLLEKSANESGVRGAGDGLPRLPGTRKEANEILSFAKSEKRFSAFDFDASREKVLNAKLDEYRYVHFATHGFLNSQHPELSGIALSMFNKKGEAEDGFFRLNEVYNLKLNADLVVLSACQTGLGKEIKGEGLVGLTRGFMYAGTPRVAVSLWSVSDEGTAELMSQFYKKMLKENMRPAKAMQEAQISMFNDKKYRSPYYWAAFTLQGEWK